MSDITKVEYKYPDPIDGVIHLKPNTTYICNFVVAEGVKLRIPEPEFARKNQNEASKRYENYLKELKDDTI